MLSLLQEIEAESMEAKPPEPPCAVPMRRKMSYKEHHNVVFEPDDWVSIPGEYDSNSIVNVTDLPSYVANSDLRSNPFEEEENDAIMASDAREDNKAIKTRN